MARPKGYAEWTPSRDTCAVLAAVREILQEYRAYLPMTARQIFYRLVGGYGYDKTERAVLDAVYSSSLLRFLLADS